MPHGSWISTVPGGTWSFAPAVIPTVSLLELASVARVADATLKFLRLLRQSGSLIATNDGMCPDIV